VSDHVIDVEIQTIRERQNTEDVPLYSIVLKPFARKTVPWLDEFNLRRPNGDALWEFTPKKRERSRSSTKLSTRWRRCQDETGVLRRVGGKSAVESTRTDLSSAARRLSNKFSARIGGGPLAISGPLETAARNCAGARLVDAAWNDPQHHLARRRGRRRRVGAGERMALARAADKNLVAVAITLATAAAAYSTRFNPLWLFAAAGLLGHAGFV
jgi:hypothetical protein